MESVVRAAARALSECDPLAALNLVALRDDPPSLALRGIAMAQLGEFTSARKLLARAARGFGDAAPASRARCVVADAEVALTSRDLAAVGPELEAAANVLRATGDGDNALFAKLQVVRRLLLGGELSEAERRLQDLDLRGAPARLLGLSGLIRADIAARRVHARTARAALEQALVAARQSAILPLVSEVERALEELSKPVARLRATGSERSLTLDEVEALGQSTDVIVDACRRQVRAGTLVVPLVKRPVLLALAVALGEAAPGEAQRMSLLRDAFGARGENESLRARLRVEIGRLRRLVLGMADVRATSGGFCLLPKGKKRVLVLLPPAESEASALLALLQSGESWSTSALATALGKSQRAVQRALAPLLEDGRVEGLGRGRSRRWVAPAKLGFATTLLLVAREPHG